MDAKKNPEPTQDRAGYVIYLADLVANPLREGNPCPVCGRGRLAYDGLLVLRCDRCGYSGDQGCFT